MNFDHEHVSYQNEEKYQRHLQTCFTLLVKAWQTGHLIEEKTLGTINAAINSAVTRTNTIYQLYNRAPGSVCTDRGGSQKAGKDTKATHDT